MPQPTLIGKYEILEELGRGGFATVYKARDPTLNRTVALKVLHPQLTADPKFVQRFHQEARAAAQFDHPHIVTIYDVGEEAGQSYMAMELLLGRPLSQLIESGPLAAEQAVSVVEQIAGALDSIHNQKLVHRDVKPLNIIVDDAGRATLLDFGIVRAAEGTRLTTTMATLGTPEYMAPEQAELEEAAGIDWRADIYALGIVAYEILVGRPPFIGQSPTGVLYKHIHEPPPAPTALNSKLDPELEPILLKALAKNRKERFQQAGTFAAELRRALLSDSQPALSSVIPSSKARGVLPRWAVAVMGGLGLVAIAATVGVIVLLSRGNKGSILEVTPTTTPIATTVTVAPSHTPRAPTHTPTQPTPTIPPTPTQHSPTSTPVPTPTHTPQPSSTPIPTPIPTATESDQTGPAINAVVGVSVSRDEGNTEVYVEYSDGSIVNVTNHPREDAYAVLSPDRTRIAFASTRNGPAHIFVMNVDGTGVTELTTAISGDTLPAWSPDGTRIVFQSLRDGNWEIYVMNADGSGQTNLTNNPARDLSPTWSPDGTQIFFETDREGNLYDYYVMNADGSGQTRR